MIEGIQQQSVRTVLALRMIAWFLGGLFASAALVVVIPPLDLLLLLGLLVATVALRVREGRFSPPVTSMLVGVTAFSIYVLIWALAIGSS
jgi:uncharacterized membrane protein YccC